MNSVKKLVPDSIIKKLLPLYHYLWAKLSAVWYRHPSKKIIVIGVTGTKGKSSTVEILAEIFRQSGKKVAQSGTIHFKIGDEDIPNLYKMSMPGRGFMQQFLRRSVDAQCDIAILEMTSQGAAQSRHVGIELDALLYTNMAPEHIEYHGSYQNYKDAKKLLAVSLEKRSKNGRPTYVIINGNNEEAYNTYKNIPAGEKIISKFSQDGFPTVTSTNPVEIQYDKKTTLTSPLTGAFNAENILLATVTAETFGVSLESAQKGINMTKVIKECGQDFEVIVDYAHTPDSLQAVYKAFSGKRIIGVLGNTGGGRDTWKRPAMAKIAQENCDKVILTDEDPYDEDPHKIIDEMKGEIDEKKLDIIMDRREAIAQALSYAKTGDAVLITGKGTDPYIMGPNNTKQEWSDVEVAKEELKKIYARTA